MIFWVLHSCKYFTDNHNKSKLRIKIIYEKIKCAVSSNRYFKVKRWHLTSQNVAAADRESEDWPSLFFWQRKSL